MFLQTKLNVPKLLHGALGRSQSVLALTGIAGFGAGSTVLVLAAHAELSSLATWRALLAAVLIFDIGAGYVANFTWAVQEYYRGRPRLLLPFLAGHVHLLIIAALLGLSLADAAVISAYALASAAIVGHLEGERQKAVAAVFVGTGLLGIAYVASSMAMVLAGQIFILKLTHAHAVNHYGLPDQE